MQMTRLTQIREQQGIPKYVLARRANASTMTIALWEKYGIPPKRRDVIERVAQVLGVDPDELIDSSDST
jgi:transcriptional regulator with XRE-family HTH domain